MRHFADNLHLVRRESNNLAVTHVQTILTWYYAGTDSGLDMIMLGTVCAIDRYKKLRFSHFDHFSIFVHACMTRYVQRATTVNFTVIVTEDMDTHFHKVIHH